jgi:hypothetical protein
VKSKSKAARPPDPWHEDCLKYAQAYESFCAINPRDNKQSWKAWSDYFGWLNWCPFWFRRVEMLHSEDKHSNASWTAPAKIPDADGFPRFKPASAKKFLQSERNKTPGWRANLFVGSDKPRYQQMVERAKTADPQDWTWAPGGIKIRLDWYRA